MKAWIHGTGNISPQGTHAPGAALYCVEPEYEQWIDARQLRRMSRVMKMGVTAALMALKNASVEKPDAIIAGTGFGCLEDTGNFLTQLVTEKEGVLNPTPFMQSTHNTIASAIAMLLQCQGYNSTYTQNAFSFEHALLDALLQIDLKPDQHILVGGFDEITDNTVKIFQRLGVVKKERTILGEGAAWAVLCGNSNKSNVAVDGIATFLKPNAMAMNDNITQFLSDHDTSKEEIDLVLCGMPVDIAAKTFPGSAVGSFKHLCGEYPCASAYAFWLAENMLRSGEIPESIQLKGKSRTPSKILIYNQYFRDHHSLILLSRS